MPVGMIRPVLIAISDPTDRYGRFGVVDDRELFREGARRMLAEAEALRDQGRRLRPPSWPTSATTTGVDWWCATATTSRVMWSPARARSRCTRAARQRQAHRLGNR
jgi:hypothetical protein